MYVSPHIVQAIHEDRIREAQRYAQDRRIRDASEPVPVEYSSGLLYQIKQLIHFKRQPMSQQEIARHAHAV